LFRANNDLVERRILGVDQAWGRAWFVRARSARDTILVTYEKLMEVGGLLRIGCNLYGRDELV